MYPYIVCYCGRSLGDLYDAFCYMRRAKYIEALAGTEFADIDPARLPFDIRIEIDMVDVFEQLNIDMMCCRARLATGVEFKTVY